MLEKFKPNTFPIPSRELFFHKFQQAKACSKSYQSHKPCKSNFKGWATITLLYSSRKIRKFGTETKKSVNHKTYAFKGGGWGSNPRHSEPQSDALTNWTTSTIWLYLLASAKVVIISENQEWYDEIFSSIFLLLIYIKTNTQSIHSVTIILVRILTKGNKFVVFT